MNTVKILSLNISEKKGVVKKPVDSFTLYADGVVGDAHAGMKNRQVSLLGQNSIDQFELSTGKKIQFGDFAENITLDTMPKTIAPLDCFVAGNIVLQTSQIGKTCHGANCSIFTETGDCVMPKEGIFCKVVSGGVLKTDDHLEYQRKTFDIRIIAFNDKGGQYQHKDISSETVKRNISAFMHSCHREVKTLTYSIPDDCNELERIMGQLFNESPDIIFTIGGTGLAPNDMVPDIIRPMFDKEIPGLMDHIRLKFGGENPASLVSRSIAGVVGKTLIYCLPSSTKAVVSYLSEIEKSLFHCIYMINGLEMR